MLEAAKQKNPNGLILLYFCDELTFTSVGEGGTTVMALRKKNPKIKLTIFDNPVVVAAIAKAGVVPVKVALTKDNVELIKKFNAVDSTVALVSLAGKPLAGMMGDEVTQSKLLALLKQAPDLQKVAAK
jgi:hypothetical protein